MRTKPLSSILFGVTLLIGSAVVASHARSNNSQTRISKALVDLKRVYPEVAFTKLLAFKEENEQIEKAGITKDNIKKMVEFKLRDSGIEIATDTATAPSLVVELTILDGGIDDYSYVMQTTLSEFVRLQRKPEVEVLATTWETPLWPRTIKHEDARKIILEELPSQLDKFCHAYLLANKKQ